MVAVGFFCLIVTLFGGASRIDSMAQLPVGIASALLVGVSIVFLRADDLRSFRGAFWFIVACAALVAVQLMPLAPALWSALPGHGVYLEAANVAGLEQPWRPISVSPDLTWASLAGLMAPMAGLLGFALLGCDRAVRILPGLIIVSMAGVVLGLAQLSGGESSPLRYYAVTNPESPVGFFANRNHYAFLLAMTLPLLALWARPSGEQSRSRAARQGKLGQGGARKWVALAGAAMLLPMVLLTGSRMGLALALVLITPSLAIYAAGSAVKWSGRSLAMAAGSIALVLATSLATIYAARATALQRLFSLNLSEDLRTQFIGPSMRITEAFFPVGSGFGTFDPVFRRFEPDAILARKYVNHAHNDLVELLIEAGIFGCALLALYLVWWAVRTGRIWRSKSGVHLGAAKVGTLITGSLLLASLVDYALRTPFFAVLFTFASLLMYCGGHARRE